MTMSKYIPLGLLLLTGVLKSQTMTENFIKTNTYDVAYGGLYTDLNKSLGSNDLLLNGNGGVSGSFSILQNVVNLNFNGSWSTTSNRLKLGTISSFSTSHLLPDMELGAIMTTISGNNVNSGIYARIQNNSLIFYSRYFLNGSLCVLEKNVPATVGLYQNLSGGYPFSCSSGGSGGGSSTLLIDNGLVRLTVSAGWSEMCELKTGTILSLPSGVTVPDTELGILKNNLNMDTGYSAKIDNNNLVFYKAETFPPYPANGNINTTVSLALNPQHKNESITYFDAMGREKQAISVKSGGTQEDIVTHFEYDNLGRKTKSYLPYAGTTQNSNFFTALPGSLQAFYNSAKYEFTPNPYEEIRLEESNLNRPQEKGFAGTDWEVIANSDNDHTVKTNYEVNELNEVRNYGIDFPSDDYPERHNLASNGFYLPGLLQKTITKDENWQPTDDHNKTTQEFKDKNGRTVLKRRFNMQQVLDTYYVYDDIGNLCYVLPPKGNDAFDNLLGNQAQINRTYPWTMLANVDAELAAEYQRLFSDYGNKSLLDSDLFLKYGGQGSFSLTSDSQNNIVFSVNMNLAHGMELVNGQVLLLDEFGTFKDAELGVLKNDGYEYIFYIRSNRLIIEGRGEVQSLQATLTGDSLLTYSRNYPWPMLVDIDPRDANDYMVEFNKYENEQALTLDVPNPYDAVGGINFSINDANLVTLSININASQPLVLKTGTLFIIPPERKVADIDFGIIGNGDYQYSLIIRDNMFIVQGAGSFTSINRTQPGGGPGSTTEFYSTVDSFCYIYYQDKRQRTVEKKIPGKDWEYFVYDKLDRVVMSQDGNLRLTSQWLFTKYDDFNRVAYTGKVGFKSPTGSINSAQRKEIQTYVDNNPSLSERKDLPGFPAGDIMVNYTNDLFPNSGTIAEINVYTVNYYDDYDFYHAPTIPQMVFNAVVAPVLKSLPTASLARVLGDDSWITKVSAYDDKGRQIWLKTTNPYLDSDTVLETQYSFGGNIMQSMTSFTKSLNAPIVILDEYLYDTSDRLLAHKQTIGSHPAELIMLNHYDDLGKLESKKIGGIFPSVISPFWGVNALQTQQYRYNVRGWLKSMNDPASAFSSQLFGYGLKYNSPSLGATALFNSNISEMTWRSLTDNQPRSYKFEYDDLSQILQADYVGNYSLPSGHTENYTEGNLTYDKNGNILSLNRYGLTETGEIDIIDDLSYIYLPKSDKLKQVVDAGRDDIGFIDTHQKEDYLYDLNGNLTMDNNKSITAITYNHLNLPEKIVFKNQDPDFSNQPKAILYVYDALGQKLERKVLEYPNPTAKFTYDGRFVYKDDVLEFANQPEGYIAYDNTSGDFSYVYQHKDHLGSVRISYKDANNDGLISSDEVIEENNYYPFGMKQLGYNNIYNPIGNETAKQYKYSGKEFDESMGLSTYDFGARNYDPAIGRWMNIDPLAELSRRFSPYTYALNNPIFFIDPDGMLAMPPDWVLGLDNKIRWDNNANSQSTTKQGDTYLGKTLNFEFNSYIDSKLWDGPMADQPAGDKLTSTVTITGKENKKGELISISASKSIKIGNTPIGDARGFYPGEGGSNNILVANPTASGVNINFEQHASVSPIEEFGMNRMGYKIVDVAQKLNIDYNNSNGSLDISVYTGIFPSATLTLMANKGFINHQMMQYNQPSFVKTHTAPAFNSSYLPGQYQSRDFSYYPTQFYPR